MCKSWESGAEYLGGGGTGRVREELEGWGRNWKGGIEGMV